MDEVEFHRRLSAILCAESSRPTFHGGAGWTKAGEVPIGRQSLLARDCHTAAFGTNKNHEFLGRLSLRSSLVLGNFYDSIDIPAKRELLSSHAEVHHERSYSLPELRSAREKMQLSTKTQTWRCADYPDSTVLHKSSPRTPKTQNERGIVDLITKRDHLLFRWRRSFVLHKLGVHADDIPVDKLIEAANNCAISKLTISQNPLGSIPCHIVQDIPTLKELDLRSCDLSVLPSEWSMPNLTSLVLRCNRLTNFPEKSILAGLPALEKLDLHGNKLCTIVVPKSSVLANLKHLDLSSNDLIYLPSELCDLKLRTLMVQNNFLSIIPKELCSTKNIKYFCTMNNPLIQPPAHICDSGRSSMKRYWKYCESI